MKCLVAVGEGCSDCGCFGRSVLLNVLATHAPLNDALQQVSPSKNNNTGCISILRPSFSKIINFKPTDCA